MSILEQFKSEVETFLAETGTAPSRFGHEAMNNRAFVLTLRRGSDVTTATIEHVRAYMDGKRAEIAARKCG